MKTIKVYDTISKKLVEVEVSDDVYVHFNRTKWNIEDNNASFYKHEIQFSQLFNEMDFSSLIDKGTEERAIDDVLIEKMMKALKTLPEKDLKLIHFLYFEHFSESKCAAIIGTTQQNISKKKLRILYKLNKLLEK
jgi:RNA polymerase sigma factor (sigma-70 family)